MGGGKIEIFPRNSFAVVFLRLFCFWEKGVIIDNWVSDFGWLLMHGREFICTICLRFPRWLTHIFWKQAPWSADWGLYGWFWGYLPLTFHVRSRPKPIHHFFNYNDFNYRLQVTCMQAIPRYMAETDFISTFFRNNRSQWLPGSFYQLEERSMFSNLCG